MPGKCSVPACRGNYDDSNKVAVFGFPTDEPLREKWLQAIQRKDFNITKNSKVCERHFKDDEVLRRTTFFVEKTGELLSAPIKRPKLKENAVPSIFPYCPPRMSSSSSRRKNPSEKQPKKSDLGSEFQNIAETSFIIKQEPDESVDEPPPLVIEKVFCAEELLCSNISSSSSSIPSVPENAFPNINPDSTNVDETPATSLSNKPAKKRKMDDAELEVNDATPDATQSKLCRLEKPSTPSNRNSKRKLHLPAGTPTKYAGSSQKRKINDAKPYVNDVTEGATQSKLFRRAKPSMSSKINPSSTSKKSAKRSTLPTKNREKATKEIFQSLVDGSKSNPLFSSRTRPGDLFDVFADFIADKLREMDWSDCAYALRAILNIVSHTDGKVQHDSDSSNTNSASSDQE